MTAKTELREARDHYKMLLGSGDLEIFFPEMTGVWKEDQELFIEEYRRIKQITEKTEEGNEV